jgi:DNA-binding protein Fis
MKEKDPSIEPVAIMARTEGYQYLRDYIEKKIKSNLARLRREVFTDLAQVALLQGEIRSLEAVLDYVNTRVKKSEGD